MRLSGSEDGIRKEGTLTYWGDRGEEGGRIREGKGSVFPPLAEQCWMIAKY